MLQISSRANLRAQPTLHEVESAIGATLTFWRPGDALTTNWQVEQGTVNSVDPGPTPPAENRLGKHFLELLTGTFWGGRPYLPWRIKFRNLPCTRSSI